MPRSTTGSSATASLLNGVDLQDTTENCDNHLWRDNVFETSVSDDCVD